MGERMGGEVVKLKSPLSGSIPARSRGEMVVITPPEVVREKFRKIKPLKDISVRERGWTLDVLNIVRRVVEERGCPQPQRVASPTRLELSRVAVSGKGAAGEDTRAPSEFTNEDVYAHARELEQLHPDNRHVRDKIRQQLQVLRDARLLIHVSSGVWRLPL